MSTTERVFFPAIGVVEAVALLAGIEKLNCEVVDIPD
jgi:hypothetical protein